MTIANWAVGVERALPSYHNRGNVRYRQRRMPDSVRRGQLDPCIAPLPTLSLNCPTRLIGVKTEMTSANADIFLSGRPPLLA